MKNDPLFPINHEDFGVEKTIAQGIEAAFTPSVEAMLALGGQFESVMSQIPAGVRPSEEGVELAAELLKKYVKVRTGTAKAHKEQKAPFYQAGKFIDGLKNAQLEASAYYEDALKAIVDYDVNVEKERLAKLQEERMEAIAPYIDTDHISYSGMPEAIWNQYLKSAKLAFETPDHMVKNDDDLKLLEDFSRFAAPGQPLSKAIEALIHEYLTSMEYKIFRGYVKVEDEDS